MSVVAACLLATGTTTPVSSTEADRTPDARTNRDVSDEDLATFVAAAATSYPEVSERDARCIGEQALAAMSIATVGMLLVDASAPVKSTPEEQAALAAAIEDCIDRPTAVQVVVGSTLRLAVRGDPTYVGVAPGYDQLTCIDDELGEFDTGEAFFAFYRRPMEFQQLTSRAMTACLDEDQLRTLLTSWLTSGESPLPEEMYTFRMLDGGCVGDLAKDLTSSEVERLSAQMIIAASPEDAGDQLDELEAFLATCGMPLPRDFGRGA